MSKSNTDNFIKRATVVHNGRYDYSKVNYTGAFTQTPAMHLKGSGCTLCSRSSDFNRSRFIDLVSKYKEGHLYLVNLSNDIESFYKIGITCREIKKRMNCFPFSKKIIHIETFYDGALLFDTENSLHNTFISRKYKPLTRFSGETECYSSVDFELFKNIISKCRGLYDKTCI